MPLAPKRMDILDIFLFYSISRAIILLSLVSEVSTEKRLGGLRMKGKPLTLALAAFVHRFIAQIHHAIQRMKQRGLRGTLLSE